MSTSIISIFMNWLNPKKIYFWVGILIILLMSTGVYIYSHNIGKLQNKKKMTDVTNTAGGTAGGDIQILFFTVTWCPHCQNAKVPWNDFKTKYNKYNTLKGRRIVCKEHDATLDDETPASKETKVLVAKYKVQGYPTIIMLKDGEQIDFDAKITTYSLEKFVEDMA